MKQSAIVVLAILIVVSAAFAKDRDRRRRRDPKSAMPPPPDYERLLVEGEKKVRALLVPWLEARSAVLAPCERCEAAGRVTDPLRPGRTLACDACRGSGYAVGPKFDPRAVDAPLWRRGDRSAYWERIRRDPAAARRIALGSYDIVEVRVVGDVAHAIVKAVPVPLHRGEGAAPEPVPDVTTWYRFGNQWRVLDPDAPPVLRRARLFPARYRPKPRHEAAAVALLARAEEGIPDRPKDGMHGLTFRVVARGTGANHDLVLTARWVGGRFEVDRKSRVFSRVSDDLGEKVTEAVRQFLDAVLSRDEALLPKPGDYHLETQGDSVVMRGFSPHLFMHRVTVELDMYGLPRSISREAPSRPELRVVPRFEEQNGEVRLVGARQVHGKSWLEYSARWVRERGIWLPKRAEVGTPHGAWSLALTPSWPKRRTDL